MTDWLEDEDGAPYPESVQAAVRDLIERERRAAKAEALRDAAAALSAAPPVSTSKTCDILAANWLMGRAVRYDVEATS